jgi:hypothetical protein
MTAELDRLVELVTWATELRKQAAAMGEKTLLGIPVRWMSGTPKYRCPNDHVSTTILKSEVLGDLCLTCQEPVLLTFPEDQDGPRP